MPISQARHHNEYIKDASHTFLFEAARTLIVGLKPTGTQIIMEQETGDR